MIHFSFRRNYLRVTGRMLCASLIFVAKRPNRVFSFVRSYIPNAILHIFQWTVDILVWWIRNERRANESKAKSEVVQKHILRANNGTLQPLNLLLWIFLFISLALFLYLFLSLSLSLSAFFVTFIDSSNAFDYVWMWLILSVHVKVCWSQSIDIFKCLNTTGAFKHPDNNTPFRAKMVDSFLLFLSNAFIVPNVFTQKLYVGRYLWWRVRILLPLSLFGYISILSPSNRRERHRGSIISNTVCSQLNVAETYKNTR